MEDRDILIPGIHNDITQEFISPKLPFSALRILSWVSRAWRRTIQSRQIYDIRVRANSTKSLGIFLYIEEDSSGGKDWVGLRRAISLYSMEENCRFLLPPVPTRHGKNRSRFVCVSLDGYVYLLGGATLDDPSTPGISKALRDVYVMDVAGMNWQWKQIASMRDARAQFGCGVVGGKIYVFGGWSSRYGNADKSQREAEVYDPKVDAWSPINTSSTAPGSGANTTAIGEELFVCNSSAMYPRSRASFGRLSFRVNNFCEVYNPRANEWRPLKDFDSGLYDHPYRDVVVFVGEKVMKLQNYNIYVYDIVAQVWNLTQSCPFKPIESSLSIKFIPLNLLAMDGEIFCIGAYEHFPKRFVLLRSQGLGGNQEIVWHEVAEFSPTIPSAIFGSIQF